MTKLAIVATHPVQYNAPWFKLLAEEESVELKVFYTWEQSQKGAKYDPDFGKVIEWDIPLLEGYDYTFVKNVSENPGSDHFKGVINPTLNQEIEDWGASAIIVIGWAFKSHLSCMKYFKGKVPVLFRGDSTLLDSVSPIKRIAKYFLLKYVYSFIDYALYVGTHNKDYFLEYGVKEKQLAFVPHAIDNNRFSVYSDEKEEIARFRADNNIDTNSFVILFAGKLEHKKNPQYLLELEKELKEEDITIVFVGNGELEKELKEQSLNNDRVKFLGFQNQTAMPLVYATADMFVLPSRGPGETWGLAINEAMAANKYVVTSTKAGCSADLIEVGSNGVVIEPDDTLTTVEFIKKVLKEKSSSQLKNQTNDKVLKTFSYKSLVSNITELLNSLN